MSRRIECPRALQERFSLRGPHAAGGMGAIFLGTLPGAETKCAVKLILSSQDDVARARFLREARLLQALDHPNLVRIHDCGDEDGFPWIAMEWVEGLPLSKLRAREGAPEAGSLARIAREVAGTLEALHGQDIAHRDVKPDNLMIEEGGRVVLLDLGVAKSSDATRLTTTGGVVGTVAFLPPEAFLRARQGPPGDWYALGATLFYLMEDRLPYSTDDLVAMATSGDWLPVRMREPPPGYESLYRLTEALMDPDPDRRPASRGEVEALLRGEDRVAPARGARRRSPAALVMAGVGVALALAGGVALATRGPAHPFRGPEGAAADLVLALGGTVGTRPWAALEVAAAARDAPPPAGDTAAHRFAYACWLREHPAGATPGRELEALAAAPAPRNLAEAHAALALVEAALVADPPPAGRDLLLLGAVIDELDAAFATFPEAPAAALGVELRVAVSAGAAAPAYLRDLLLEEGRVRLGEALERWRELPSAARPRFLAAALDLVRWRGEAEVADLLGQAYEEEVLDGIRQAPEVRKAWSRRFRAARTRGEVAGAEAGWTGIASGWPGSSPPGSRLPDPVVPGPPARAGLVLAGIEDAAVVRARSVRALLTARELVMPRDPPALPPAEAIRTRSAVVREMLRWPRLALALRHGLPPGDLRARLELLRECEVRAPEAFRVGRVRESWADLQLRIAHLEAILGERGRVGDRAAAIGARLAALAPPWVPAEARLAGGLMAILLPPGPGRCPELRSRGARLLARALRGYGSVGGDPPREIDGVLVDLHELVPGSVALADLLAARGMDLPAPGGGRPAPRHCPPADLVLAGEIPGDLDLEEVLRGLAPRLR